LVTKSKGRTPVSDEIIDLIIDLKRQNPFWGALRISQELKLLGVSIHKKTIQRILKEFGFLPPKLKFHPTPWSELFKRQIDCWAMDFTCVFDRLGNQLFILVVIDTVSRKLILINATHYPDKKWLMQQFRNIAICGYTFPKSLIIDNDGIYGKWIDKRFRNEFKIRVHRIPKGKPWHNGTCERFHLTLKAEVLNRVLIYDLSQVQGLCTKYREYYNNYRPHQSLGGNTPNCNGSNVPKFAYVKVRKSSEVDRLITRFHLAA
jgi:putative transposase